MSKQYRSVVVTLTASALALAANPSRAALTVLSSDRSASATANAHDGTSLLPPGTPPANPLVTASSSTTTAGPFNFDTGTLSAWGRSVTPDGAGYVVDGQTSALASAAFTSDLSPTAGFSATSALAADTLGAGSAGYGADASAQTRYLVSFSVDVPTSFTLTGNYAVPPRSPDASSIQGDYWIEVKLTDHLNVDLTGRTRDGVHPTPFAISGTFLPGTTYTLEAELRLENVHRNIFPLYETDASLDFALTNLTPVPEPAACIVLAATALLTATRRRR